MNNQPNLKTFDFRGKFDITNQEFVSVEILNTSKQQVMKPASENKKINNPKLIEHVKNGNMYKVKKLLNEGCDPNVRESNGTSCLNIAINNNNVELVELLINAGENVNKKECSAKMSPLNYCCYARKKEMIEVLIKLNAYINDRDCFGDTCLHNAIMGTIPVDNTVIKLLLDSGADYTIKNNDGQTPLDAAKARGYTETIKLIEDFIKFKENKTMLCETQQTEQTQITTAKVEQIAQQTIQVPKKIEKIKNPKLHKIFENCYIKTVDLIKMLDENCDPDVEDSDRKTCMGKAIAKSDLESVELLVNAGADVNKSINKNNMSPLHYACYENKPKIAEFLINAGANIEAVENSGDTPLHNACYGNCLEMVYLLLEKGVDYTKRNKKGQTPLMIAKGKKYNQCIELIEEHIKSKQTSQNKLVVSDVKNTGHTDIVEVTASTPNGKTINFKGPYEFAMKFIKKFN